MSAHVVIAPDSFKGTITARDAANAIAEGWRAVDEVTRLITRPMADGGEGTLSAFATSIPAAEAIPVTVSGPHRRPVPSEWLLLPPDDGSPQGTAVVELANTCGIELLSDSERHPMDAGSEGFGQAIAAALDRGVSRLILGIGGSASTDGGAGMLAALGVRILDADGRPIATGARGLSRAVAVDFSQMRAVPPGGALVITDVTNGLLGEHGAARVFGPQKGASPTQIDQMDVALHAWSSVVGSDPAQPGSGAAGGVGYALAAWGADLSPGASEVARTIDLDAAIAGAALVITGEGSYDGQSGSGKAPWYVAQRASEAGIPAVMIAGRICTDTIADFAAAISLSDLAGSAASALRHPAHWLRIAGSQLARQYAVQLS